MSRSRLSEVSWVFLKLGTIGFGGPAAHVSMMRREIVVDRAWVSEREFLDAFSATSLIPGPGSTQLALYLARRRAGWRGLIAGGLCFIAPAMTIVLTLAWAYVRYGRTPAGVGILYGVAPVVVAIVADAVLGLGRMAVRGAAASTVTVLALGGYLLGVNIFLMLFVAGAAITVIRNRDRIRFPHASLVAPLAPLAAFSALAQRRPAAGGPSLGEIVAEFLKLGSIVFGSGYVLFAYLHRDLVTGLGWLTPRQLLDALAVGQVTPGPVFTTATFIGYVLHGFAGALVATLAIFLPSFLLIAALWSVIPKLRRSPWAAAALDGVNAAAVGVMAGVCWDLGRAALRDPLTWILAAGSLLVLLRFRLNYAWLVAVGVAAGLAHAWLR